MPATDRLRAALDDRYRIEREIGAGGMATVYLARDLKHDREVALKVLRSDLSAIIGAERFLAEVRITAQLDHPHILVLIDSGVADGTLYYVLPYVRGESLRSKLTREKQLGLDEAMSITKQIASALDYAHRQGVVHRDIKPENILLHEGEAMLADFGIALAVKEAGGDRLTETGLSLGTPQYMSPEQATGDRTLDARSDVYSLGAVFYEMVAGEPPVTGATAQAVIAKLLTERPTGLRVIRNTVPLAMERATEKALAKVPADRFKTAGEFSAALEAAVAVVTAREPSRPSMTARMVAVSTVVVALGAVAFLVARGRSGGGTPAGVTLRDRTQLTTTGRVRNPSISGDGKSLAYVTTNCRATGCTYGVELQDVGGTASRRLYDGATALYDVIWSPDRRNVLIMGSIGGQFGTFLLSALGGTPHQVSTYRSTFFAGGDSLLSIRSVLPAAEQWILVSGLDGVVRDSIRVPGPAGGISFVSQVPSADWIAVHVEQPLNTEWRIIDRHGRERSRVTVPSSETRQGTTSSDALWISLSNSNGTSASVVRIPLDRVSGKLASRGDTLYAGTQNGFSVTSDGSALVLDEGTTEYEAWVLDLSDALRGTFPEQKKLAHATTELSCIISPDGQRVLLVRAVGTASGQGRQFAVKSIAGGDEALLALPIGTVGYGWADSTHVAFRQKMPAGLRLARFDIVSGTMVDALTLPDSSTNDWDPLPNSGWVWVPRGSRTVRVQRSTDTKPTNIVMPQWFSSITTIASSMDGRSLAFAGWKAPKEDSLGFGIITLADGKSSHWFTRYGESASLAKAIDGSFVAAIEESQRIFGLHHAHGPGMIERMGAIPRTLSTVSLSADLRRAAIVSKEYRGDAWLHRVVRP